MSAFVDDFKTWFAICVDCRWKGPMRYSESEALSDEHAHNVKKHTSERISTW